MRALRLTGLSVVTKVDPQFGEFVCKIGDVGTDASDCPARDGSYWSYFRLDANGVWRPSSVGASSAKVRCGNGEGWAWFARGVGTPPSAPTSFSSMCPGRTCQDQPSPRTTARPTPSKTVSIEPRRASRSTPSAASEASPSVSSEIRGNSAEEPPGLTAAPASGPGADRVGEDDPGVGRYLIVGAVILGLASLTFYLRRIKGS